MRVGEIVALEWTDIDLERRQISVRHSDWKDQLTSPKNGGNRFVAMTERVAARAVVRLNVALPIAFDGFGTLEVDRDRRKDQLLQESGYTILRFLAEDAGRELDLVLDAILRALSHRQAMHSPTEPLHFVRQG